MHAYRKITLLLCPLLLTLSPTAMAQAVIAASQPATQTAPATAPTTMAATAPVNGLATQPAASAPALVIMPASAPAPVVAFRPGAKLTLNFKDASLDAVLDYLSKTAGFVVFKDTSPIDGRVTVQSDQPISHEESITLLNTALKTNGYYTYIKNDRELHVTTRDKAKKGNLPVRFGADAAKIPVNEDFITQVIPVSSIDAAKLRTDLTPLMSDADVTANAGSNTIIITDTSANIHHIVEVIAAVDQHQTAVNDIKVFKLKNASAANAAKLISDIFKPGSSQGNQAAQGGQGGGGRAAFFQRLMGGGGPGGPGGGGPGGGSDTSGAYSTGTVNVSSDDRTNTLVVSGPTETLKVIEGVVKEIDADPTQTTMTFIYNLKNADATNLQGVLNSFFGMGTGSTGTSNRSSPYTSSTAGGSLGSSSSGGIGGNSSRGGSGGFGGSSNFGSSFGSTGSNNNSNRGSIGGGTSINSSTAKANSDLAGQVFVVADTGTNSLLVTAPSKDQARVTAMIDELDRAVPQVLIKVLIAEVTHSNSSDIGVEWSVLDTRASGKGTTGGSDFGLASAIAAATAAGGPNGLVVKIAEENLSAALKLLANNNKLDVLSRPYILASDNQQASIMVGQSVPFVTGSDVTSVGTIINQVQYNDIGIILNVTPHINPDGLVILDVDPEVSSLSGQTVTIQAGVNAPVFNKRAVLSRVGIKDGQTVIIGGLMQDIKTSNVDKIPLLGDIPYLGALFRHTTESKTKTELLIFLTPHVALQPDALKSISEQEKASTKLVPNAVAPGVFDEHMRGMNIGSSTQPAHTRPSVVVPLGSQSPSTVHPAEPNGQEPIPPLPPPPPGAPEQ